MRPSLASNDFNPVTVPYDREAVIDSLKTKRVAVIHEWLVTYAGAERVLEQILKVFPQAEVFSLIDFLKPEQREFLQGCPVTSSFVQNIPFSEKQYRQYLAILPLAVEQFNLTDFDLVISSQYCVSHGVITAPGQLHLSYVHSPMRYAWDLYHQYMHESGLDKKIKGWVAKVMLHRIRQWDVMAAKSVDAFVANSEFVAKRVNKYYRRHSDVIHPPVDVDGFSFQQDKSDYYVTASRMVPYKKIDLIVEAFRHLPDKKLVVVGDGPDAKKIRALGGANVEFLGQAPFDVLRDRMQNAKAFIFAAEEDFGIVPLEAQACGTPVIALGQGGALETVRGLDSDKPTGVHFEKQDVASLLSAIERFELESDRILPANCRENALRFSSARFRQDFLNYVADHYALHTGLIEKITDNQLNGAGAFPLVQEALLS